MHLPDSDQDGEKGFVMTDESTIHAAGDDIVVAEITDTTPGTALDLADSFDLTEYNALRGFVLYMQDIGVRSWMLRLIALSIYPYVTIEPSLKDKTATDMFDDAVRDLVKSSEFIRLEDVVGLIGGIADAFLGNGTSAPKPAGRQIPQFDLRKVAGGAASLKLLWDYAQGLPLYILPQHCRPSAATIERCLEVFHIMYAETLAEQARGSE